MADEDKNIWTPPPFSITMPILKAWKSESGDMLIQGLGGDAEVDDQNDRLSTECIADMKNQAFGDPNNPIPMLRGHWNQAGKGQTQGEWWDQIGEIKDLFISPLAQMFPTIFLDPEPELSKMLFGKVQRGKKFGLSWGGGVVKAHKESNPDTGKIIRVFDKIKFWHIVPTTRPVNSRTLNDPLTIISKSFDWSGVETIETKSDRDAGYEDREKVYAIYKSVREDADAFKSWYQDAGVQSESDLDDGDFAWISNDGKTRKLPYKIHGKVNEKGWRAAWNAAHGSRGGMSFEGGPSKEQVLAKLLRDKPDGIEVKKSEDSASVEIDGISVFKSESPDLFGMVEKSNKDGIDMTDAELKALAEAVGKSVGEQFTSAFKAKSDADEAKLPEILKSVVTVGVTALAPVLAASFTEAFKAAQPPACDKGKRAKADGTMMTQAEMDAEDAAEGAKKSEAFKSQVTEFLKSDEGKAAVAEMFPDMKAALKGGQQHGADQKPGELDAAGWVDAVLKGEKTITDAGKIVDAALKSEVFKTIQNLGLSKFGFSEEDYRRNRQ